jgi:hypothetical protein
VPKFMLLFVGLAAPGVAADAQTQDYMAQWGRYMGALAQEGSLESGLPFEPTGKVVGKDAVSELELGTVDIGGYLLVNAASMDDAIEISRRAPHMALGGTTIVRPCLELGG